MFTNYLASFIEVWKGWPLKTGAETWETEGDRVQDWGKVKTGVKIDINEISNESNRTENRNSGLKLLWEKIKAELQRNEWMIQEKMSRYLSEHRNCDLERQGENDRFGSGKQDNCSHPGPGGHRMRGETQRPFMGLWERPHPLEVGRVQPVRDRIWLWISPILWGHPLRSGFTLASSFPTGKGNAHHQLPHAAGCLLFLVSFPYAPTVISSIND